MMTLILIQESVISNQFPFKNGSSVYYCLVLIVIAVSLVLLVNAAYFKDPKLTI